MTARPSRWSGAYDLVHDGAVRARLDVAREWTPYGTRWTCRVDGRHYLASEPVVALVAALRSVDPAAAGATPWRPDATTGWRLRRLGGGGPFEPLAPEPEGDPP